MHPMPDQCEANKLHDERSIWDVPLLPFPLNSCSLTATVPSLVQLITLVILMMFIVISVIRIICHHLLQLVQLDIPRNILIAHNPGDVGHGLHYHDYHGN